MSDSQKKSGRVGSWGPVKPSPKPGSEVSKMFNAPKRRSSRSGQFSSQNDKRSPNDKRKGGK